MTGTTQELWDSFTPPQPAGMWQACPDHGNCYPPFGECWGCRDEIARMLEEEACTLETEPVENALLASSPKVLPERSASEV